jgi:hypothetical protein
VATTQEIAEVRTAKYVGDKYEHITYVKLRNGTVLSRDTVLSNLRNAWGDSYVTYKPGVPAAKVIAVSCPGCTYSDYITTEPDYTEENNLLDLPRF